MIKCKKELRTESEIFKSNSLVVRQVVVLPTDRGSNPDIAPKKIPLAVLAGCGSGASPAQVTVHCASLGNGVSQPKFGLAL